MMLSRSDLHAYQEKAVAFIKEKKKCALFLDLGLGKTTTTLTFLADMNECFAIQRTLIIAPLRVANSVWAQEAEKWAHVSHLRIAVVTGDPKTREKALRSDSDVYVINRENLDWLYSRVPESHFDSIVVDESSSFKNHASKRFKRLKKVAPHANYIILLTATPSPNGLIDLWSQMYLLDSGKALGLNITRYRQTHFDQSHSGFGYKIKKGSDRKIHDAIAHMTLSMQASDYLTMPDKIMIDEYVTLDDSARKVYDDFESEMLLEVSDDVVVEALSAAHLANKLLQLASGAIYTDLEGSYHVIHDAKIEALKEIVEMNDETVLVAYNYKSDLARLQCTFPDAVVLDKDPRTIERWNRGEIKMMLVHPQSAGHGLNLQHGGALLVWFSLSWNLEYYLQLNARLYRQGQTKPVRIIHLLAEKTIDDRVLKALKNKDLSQFALLDALKR